MKLYHGSNIKVISPKILDSKRALDFGKGFYLTTDLEQAIKWSKLMVKRREEGEAIVSVFEYEEKNSLKILKFESPNSEWLKFVSNHRKMIEPTNRYDIVIGPIANDNTMSVINMYLSGQYEEEEALKRLLPQKLKDQIVFKSNRSLEYLKFKEVLNCEENPK